MLILIEPPSAVAATTPEVRTRDARGHAAGTMRRETRAREDMRVVYIRGLKE